MYYNWDTAYDHIVDYECGTKPLPTSIRLQKEDFGYPIYLVKRPRREGGYAIISGCRFLSPTEARAHWAMRENFMIGRTEYNIFACVRARATNMLALLPKLKRRAKSYGWI